MRYLFIFAHPDDETVACAGTIMRLDDHNDDVILVSVTDGGAGEVSAAAQKELEKYKTVGELRTAEFIDATLHMGIVDAHVWDFKDGEITNKDVWGALTLRITELIDRYRPDAIVTFDHSGWYFHLDHVGVSIATTLAYHQAKHRADLFFHVHFRVNSSKWRYVFNEHLPITHRVDVSEYLDDKLTCLNLHASQDLSTPRQHIQEQKPHYELYQLVWASDKGKESLPLDIFEPVA